MAVDVLGRENNVQNNELKGWPSTMLDETVQCMYTLLEDYHCLAIINMWQEMAAHFSHTTSEATIVCALQ